MGARRLTVIIFESPKQVTHDVSLHTCRPPPPAAIETAQKLISDPAVSRYGPNEGLPELRAALRKKLAEKNGLHHHNVCVTHGANQAFINIVLSLVDSSDRVVLFKPVYFDHLMVSVSLQSGSTCNGQCMCCETSCSLN